MSKRELAKRERERIKRRAIEMYETGMSAAEVGKRLHIADSTIYGYLRDAGKVRPRGGTTPVSRISEDELHRTVELYQMGFSCMQVGNILGITHSSVQNRLERAGCPLRPRGEALQIRWKDKIQSEAVQVLLRQQFRQEA